MLEAMLEQVCGTDLLDTIRNALNMNLFDSEGPFKSALTSAKVIHESAIQPIAVMLLFIYFMLAVIDKLSSENFTWEQLWRTMAMLLASKFLIDHGFEILGYLWDVGLLALDEVYAVVEESDIQNTFVAEDIINNFRESLMLNGVLKVLGNLIVMILLFFPWILSFIMELLVLVIVYSRMIEIYVRAAFAPIALSDFFHSGLQGTGWRYLKGFLAVCLQGVLIYVIAVLYSRLMVAVPIRMEEGNPFAGLFKFVGLYLAYYASAIMIMFKSQSIAKELLGTN